MITLAKKNLPVEVPLVTNDLSRDGKKFSRGYEHLYRKSCHMKTR